MLDRKEDFKTVLGLIKTAKSIVITSHKSPDGDSLGSSLALLKFIQKFNANVLVCHPDQASASFNWLKDIYSIHLFKDNRGDVIKFVQESDLVFCLDYNSYDRLGEEFGGFVQNSGSKKILIDHHQNPTISAEVSISETAIASTSELIFELIEQSGQLDLLDQEIARYIYLGIMTDTGSFRFPSVSSRTHEIAAKLLETGLPHAVIHESIFDTNTLDRIKLKSYAIVEKLEILQDLPIGLIYLEVKELNQFNYQKGDTEGLVNTILSIENIMVAALFIETDEGVKISFRSKGSYFVNELASVNFNGGGHKYAAGGFSAESIFLTKERFKAIILSGFYNSL
jgi:phosphoesterase RecJ-like protein